MHGPSTEREAQSLATSLRRRMVGYARMEQFLLVGLLAAALVACVDRPGNDANATVTPIPTPPNTVAAICDSARRSLTQLELRIDPESVAKESLVDQGAAVAQMTGILATDVDRLRALAETGYKAEPWLDAMDAAIELGVTAVRASASEDVGGFAAAVRAFEDRRSASRALSSDIGYPSCPY